LRAATELDRPLVLSVLLEEGGGERVKEARQGRRAVGPGWEVVVGGSVEGWEAEEGVDSEGESVRGRLVL
jgi:hypothetical protein